MSRSQGEDSSKDTEPPAAEAQAGAPPFWEWAAAAVGLTLLLASLGYLTVQAAGAPMTPPDPVVEATSVHPQGGRYLVVLRVHNRGEQTAEALKVAGELRRGGEVLERVETEFQFLPGGSSRDGGLFFSRDPQGFELVLKPESYQAP